MDDNDTIRLFAGLNNRALRMINSAVVGGDVRSPYLNHPRNGYQPPQPHQLPPQLQMPNIGEQFPSIPSEIPNQISNLIPLPKDDKGNTIVPPELIGYAPNTGLNTSSFAMPNYGTTENEEGKEDRIDLLLKEVKALKRAINKLTKLVTNVTVGTVTSTTNDINSQSS